MNNVLGNILIFTAGVATGIFVGKKVYESYYANLANEEIESVKDIYYGKKENTKPDTTVLEDKQPKRGMRIQNAPVRENEKINVEYHKMHKGYIEDETVVDEQYLDDTAYGEPVEKQKASAPYLISLDTFEVDCLHHDKICIDYYIDDKVFLDEDQSVMNDIQIKEAFGIYCVSAIHKVTTDKIMYVRNEKLEIDYEVSILTGKSEDTLYEVPAPVKNLTPREAYAQKERERNG